MDRIKEIIKKSFKIMTGSRLNLCVTFSSVIMIILIFVVFGVALSRDEINNIVVIKTTTQSEESSSIPEETIDEQSSQTTQAVEEFTTVIDESATTNVVRETSMLRLTTKITRSWYSNGKYYIQYDFSLENISGKEIDGWALVMDLKSEYEIIDSWNFKYNEGYKKLVVNPTNANKNILAGDSISGGFVVCGNQYVYIDYITIYVGNVVETIKNYAVVTTQPTTTNPPKDDTTTIPEEISEETDTSTIDSDTETTSESGSENTEATDNITSTDVPISTEEEDTTAQTDISTDTEIDTEEDTTPIDQGTDGITDIDN